MTVGHLPGIVRILLWQNANNGKHNACTALRSEIVLLAIPVATLKEILKEKHSQIYAFSSIMRISNNNINQEEKEYWNKYGKKIFD